MLIKCPRFQELRTKNKDFLINNNTKHELNIQLNSMTRGQIKRLANFTEEIAIKEKANE